MKILMMMDGLVFVGTTEQETKHIEGLSNNLRMKDTPKGLKVQGTPKELYQLIYHLSYDFDVEIV